MWIRRPAAFVAALLVPVWLLLSVPAVLAKGEIEARLDTALSTDAAPGTVVTVGWTLSMLEGDAWIGIDPGNVFVRLIGGGGAVTEVRATGSGSGHFVARIAVPAGGIATTWIGSDDNCIGPTCTRTAEQLFPIAGVGAPPAVVPASDLRAVIDPLPALGPPYSAVEVTVRVSLEPGADLAGRVFPGSLMIRALDPRTDLAAYVAAAPIGQGVYRGELQLPSTGTLLIEAGTRSRQAVGLDQVLARLADPLVLPPVGAVKEAAPAPAVAPAPASTVASTAAAPELPIALVAIAGAVVVLVGLVLARGSRRHPVAR
jgi:hypothetical protein